MKTLILTRHAKSSWKDAGLSDHDRPLNERGRGDAPRMAAHLAANYPVPQHIVSSTALRAATTARSLAERLACPAENLAYLPRLYLADPATLLAVARELPDELDTVMLVGHNPGMTEFLNALTGAGIENLPTCGVARVGFEVASWRDMAPGVGRLLSLDVPRTLPGPRGRAGKTARKSGAAPRPRPGNADQKPVQVGEIGSGPMVPLTFRLDSVSMQSTPPPPLPLSTMGPKPASCASMPESRRR